MGHFFANLLETAKLTVRSGSQSNRNFGFRTESQFLEFFGNFNVNFLGYLGIFEGKSEFIRGLSFIDSLKSRTKLLPSPQRDSESLFFFHSVSPS